MKRYERPKVKPIPPEYRCYDHGVGVPIVTINGTHLCAVCIENYLSNIGVRKIIPVEKDQVHSEDRAKIWPFENFGDKADPYISDPTGKALVASKEEENLETFRHQLQSLLARSPVGHRFGLSPSTLAEFMLRSLLTLEVTLSKTRSET